MHPAVADRLARLTPDQRAAATAAPGPVLCVAPAGSGKTTTLVARVAWLVDGGLEPTTVTAITFNARAAEELRERLDAALAPLAVAPGAVRVRTFHALGREILADAGVDVSRLADRRAVLEELFGAVAVPAAVRVLDDAFSRRKLDPSGGGDGRERGATLAAAFARYQEALDARGALDFDDLVARPVARLRGDAPLLARWRARASAVLVDEVQDLDRTQLELALLLAGPAANAFFVGDDDQTIYAWRLADVRRVIGLAGRLPGLRRVDLVTNHRCPAPVVERAVRLVEHNTERFSKRIVARPDAVGALVLAPDPGDASARARRLVRTWACRADGTYAVLARTNAELAPFAASAIEHGVPYRADDDGLVVDEAALDEVLAATIGARGADAAPLPALEAARRAGAPAAVGLLIGWAAAYRSLDALRGALADARRARSHLRRDDARLVLATIHGTKGLEFDHVASVGLDEGVFPSGRAISDSADPARALEEERRLAYVAWTRARRSLLLLFDPAAPSRFLREAFDADELVP